MINLGASGGAKWFDSSCVPKQCMVVENRFELYHKADQANFWDIFAFARDNGIKQIITIDCYIDRDRHYYPSEAELRQATSGIKKALIDNGISKDMACFQYDNEPAKHKVPVATYCNNTNIIHHELNGAYDLYVGGEEVSYRHFYNYVVPYSHNEGIAFHLQNCALNALDTNDSVNFIYELAKKYGKKVTCSEGNYLDPSKEYTYNMIKYHIQKCRDIGALDYCVIFLALNSVNKNGTKVANASNYKWLSFVYDNTVRSEFYDDYINLCLWERLMSYLRPEQQQKFYEAMGWGDRPYYYDLPSLPIQGHKDPGGSIKWADFDAVFESLAKGLVKALKDNQALPSEFPEPMDIKYKADGSWNGSWQSVAKSNPKEGL